MDMYQKREMRKNKKMNEDVKSLPSTSINWYPGHMAKTKRQIQENLNLIDVAIEVIDSRIPYSSKNKDIDNILKDKERIIIMTKYDLCDTSITDKWIKYYKDKGYTVIEVDLLRRKNINKINDELDKCYNLVNSKRYTKGLKERKLRVLIVGIPNVGKSTLINTLVNKKAVKVGNTPGVTKDVSWIRINDKVELMDTPGILSPRLENNEVALNLASLTSIKEEILNLDEVCIHIIDKLRERYLTNITERYNIQIDDDIVNTLDSIGKKIGAVRNNEVDYDRVYKTVLKDLREGYLGRVTFDYEVENVRS